MAGGRNEFEVCKAQIDRDAAGFFLGQAVRVRAGERLDQRTLPVIHVAGRRDNKMQRGHRVERGTAGCVRQAVALARSTNVNFVAAEVMRLKLSERRRSEPAYVGCYVQGPDSGALISAPSNRSRTRPPAPGRRACRRLC